MCGTMSSRFPASCRDCGLSSLLLSALVMLLTASASLHAASTTYTVSSIADTETAGTLRWAIERATANPGDTINFDGCVALEPITLGSALPIITTSVTINGAGSRVDGNDLYRIFFVNTANSTDVVSINNLTLRDGYAKGGDAGASA